MATYSSKTFQFLIDDEVNFSCRLKSLPCEATNAKGHRCGKRSVIGTPLCWIHLLYQKHLRIKPSKYGQGLFASDPKKGENAVIFRKGQTIIAYGGETINLREIDRRYDGKTAPYGVGINENKYQDGACERGIGGLANHRSSSQKPNARFGFTAPGHVLVLKAEEPIRNNREIFLDYNKGDRGKQYRFKEKGVSYITR